jgi:hypothetical protein
MSGGAINEADGSEGLPRSADLQRLLAYWHERRGAREFPRRADVDPLDIRFMLDRIALTEVHDPVDAGPVDPGSRRYRLRLVGSFWYRLVGFEMTGMWTHEFRHANQRKLTEDFYMSLLEGRRPRFVQRDVIVDDQLLHYEIMLLPLSEDGSRISMIMTGIGPD